MTFRGLLLRSGSLNQTSLVSRSPASVHCLISLQLELNLMVLNVTTYVQNALNFGSSAAKGVIYNQEKHIRDLKISNGIGGRQSTEGRYWGGGVTLFVI